MGRLGRRGRNGGAPGSPRRSGRGRRLRAGVETACRILALAGAVFLMARPGGAYRFYTTHRSGSALPTRAYAARWDEARFPVRYRLLQNNLAAGWSTATMRTLIEETLSEWNAIPTSSLRVELERDALRANGVAFNGVNEIGFADDRAVDARAYATLGIHNTDTIDECDVVLNPEYYAGRTDSATRRDLRHVLMHEMGHCLGLRHSEPYPVPDWAADVPATYYPPPVMAYTWETALELAEDDRIGISLLYPAAGFARTRGAVAGRVVTSSGWPARFVYVQALDAHGEGGFGPGAFANENGYFVLEGLPPRPMLLWVHPPLRYAGRDPHPRLPSASPSTGAGALRDQWRWVTATAGETVVVPTIRAPTGRRSSR